MLNYIKSMLQVGTINTSNTSQVNIAEYCIQNIDHIIKYILLIFDKYSLLTKKEFSYNQFREAILIYKDISLSHSNKDYLITNIKKKIMPTNYVSSV